MSYGAGLSEDELLQRMLQSAQIERRAARKRDGGNPLPTAKPPTQKRYPVDPNNSTRYIVLQLLASHPHITNELLTHVLVTRQQLKVVLRRLLADDLITKVYVQQGNCKMAKWSLK